MFEAMKAVVSAYMQYERDQATEESLRSLAARLDNATRLIQQNYQSILNTLVAIRHDEVKGKLVGTIDQFRLLHAMSRTQRELFQRDCAYLTSELVVLASNKTSYNVDLRPYDFLSMLTTLAPIHAFANRCLGIREVRYIFERAHLLSIDFIKAPYGGSHAACGDYDLWCDPGFLEQRGDVSQQFKDWVDNNLHPFSRLLLGARWEMKMSRFPQGIWFPSVDGLPIPNATEPNQGKNLGQMYRIVSEKSQFKEVTQIEVNLKNTLAQLPRLTTEAEPIIYQEKNETPDECPRPLSPRTIAAYQSAGLLGNNRIGKDNTDAPKREREEDAASAKQTPQERPLKTPALEKKV